MAIPHLDELGDRLGIVLRNPEAIRQALGLLAEGIVRPDLLVTQEAPLQGLPELFGRMLRDKDSVKTAVIP